MPATTATRFFYSTKHQFAQASLDSRPWSHSETGDYYFSYDELYITTFSFILVFIFVPET